jgi:Nif-specific regulatory protein
VRAADVQLYGVYEISKLLASPGRLEVTLAQVMHLLASFLDMRHGLIAAERSGTSSSRQRG